MTQEELQALMNATFSGLALFCRDADLDDKLIDRYRPGQILMERGLTDMSYKIGGLRKNCRFLIASARGKDLSMFSPEATQNGHILLPSKSFFKVLDVHRSQGKTQILLLNVPEEGAGFFAKAKINLEEQIVERGRESFTENLSAAPVAALQNEEWINRTSFPVGMSDDGAFFMETEGEGPPDLKAGSVESEATPAEKGTPPPAEKKGFWDKLFGK
jgi:hypothetical protein